MKQSRKYSFIEAFVGTGLGYINAVCLQLIVYPLFDIHVSHSENLVIAAIFTVVSLIRGYLIRRLFNHFNDQ